MSLAGPTVETMSLAPTTAHGPIRAAGALLAWAEDHFAGLVPLQAATRRALAEEPTTAGMARLVAPVATRLLAHTDLAVVGAGFVAAPAALDDTAYWLEWWTADEPGDAPQRLVVETDPAGDTFRDWTTLPWFAVPATTGRRHITGPYVDYLCTDEYTLTFTMPVHRDEALAGVVGCDVYVRHVEQLAEGWLDLVEGPSAFVSREGRVLVSSAPGVVTGDLLRSLPLARLWEGATVPGLHLTACGDLPFGLVVGEALAAGRRP